MLCVQVRTVLKKLKGRLLLQIDMGREIRMKKTLTISVAAYNVQNTIRKTLDSFCKSKYLNDMEIIVVDDGSEDATAELVKEYETQYPDSIHLISKENGGHGSTINTSIEKGSGKFFKVVDGDDWVDPVALDSLIELLQQTKADLVVNDYVEVYPDKKIPKILVNMYDEGKIYFMNELPTGQQFPMHGLTVSLSILKQLPYRISEHKFYADTEYIFFIMLVSQTVQFQKKAVYQYRLGESGQSVSPEGVYNHIEDYLFIVDRLMGIFEKESLHMDLKKSAMFRQFIIDRYNLAFSWFNILKKHDKDYLLKEFDQRMQNKYPELVYSIPLGKKRIIRWNYTAGLFALRLWRNLKKLL